MKDQKGFTLGEVLVAMSLFTVVAVVATGVLVDVVQLQKKSSAQNPVYNDSKIIMKNISNLIKSGTIDYEEYYNMNVVQKKKPVTGGTYYGINYGVYSSRFFDPGKSQTPPSANPADLGIECSYPIDDTSKPCEIYYSDSSDLNTGQNPYKNNPGLYTSEKATAVCDEILTAGSCANVSNVFTELYLIDSSGKHKTILGLQNITSGTCGANDDSADCAIGMVKMSGYDLDQNGVVDVFSCDEDYNCTAIDTNIAAAFKQPFIVNCIALNSCKTGPQEYLNKMNKNGIKLPKQGDLELSFDNKTSQFIPITPKRVSVKALSFRINPLDDPYKAYAETDMQTQPTVTITMTLGLSSEAKEDYPGDFPDITLQSTVAAGVIGKIDSYPPVNDVLRSDGETSWIEKVLK